MEKENQQSLQIGTAEPMGHDDTIDLEELMLRLVAGWKMIVCLALVFALAAGFYALRIAVPMYSATASIYVLASGDSVVNLSDLQLGSALANDYLELFDMWEVHDKVISDKNLNYTYAQMKNRLSVVNPSNTRILKITFTSPSPYEAADVANAYATVASDYIENVMSTERPNLMSVARVPLAPVSPNKPRIVILGFVGGFLLGCAWIIVRFLLDDKIKSSADIRKYTGLATLATIPLDTASSRKQQKEARK